VRSMKLMLTQVNFKFWSEELIGSNVMQKVQIQTTKNIRTRLVDETQIKKTAKILSIMTDTFYCANSRQFLFIFAANRLFLSHQWYEGTSQWGELFLGRKTLRRWGKLQISGKTSIWICVLLRNE